MAVVASPNADGSSPRSGFAVVTAIDEDAGTVTLDDQSDITSFADSDILFRKGDEDGGVFDGLASHLPLTAPSSGESFRGVERSAHTRHYAGVRVNDTSTPIEENAGLVGVKIAQTARGRASHLLLNPINFWQVCRRLGAKVEYNGAGGTVGYGFEGMRIHTPAGSVLAVSDPDCPTNRGYMLNTEDFCWSHVPGGPWIYTIKDDKLGMFLRVHNADAIEGRIASTGNTIMWRGGTNGVFAI